MLDNSPLGTILVVDDDTNVTDLLLCNLRTEGYGVQIEPMAKDVDLNLIADVRLVIADASNQDYTGIDLMSEMKSRPLLSNIPVIICSDADDEEDVLTAFDFGADDFVAKPFSLRELLARLKAVLRRHPRRSAPEGVQINSSVISFPALRLSIDTDTQRVIEDGIVVPLTRTEYSILIFLIKNQNEFFSRDQICDEVWKDEPNSNPRVVDTNISRLRKKLGETGKYIINRYGQGYAFVDKI